MNQALQSSAGHRLKEEVREMNEFPEEAVEVLGCYVYRLIDPRNGETFYVGIGRRQRVFHHVNDVSGGDFDPDPERGAADPKLERIRDIHAQGMTVQHIIHRHGMSETAAKEVEAALIDAYPGLENRVKGTGSDRGTRHADEIIREYTAEEFVVRENLIMISIGQLYHQRGAYEAVRGSWKMNRKRAENHGQLVLARYRKVIVGAYRPKEWLSGMDERLPDQIKGRCGFVGEKATDVWDEYVGKRVPEQYLKRGARIAYRYLYPP